MLTSTERLRILSRIFTRPTFASLSKSGDWRLACGFLEQHGLVRPGNPSPLASLFDSAWKELRLKYRTEYIYKNEIANRLIFGLHSPRIAAMHVEFPVGRSIVDVAVFNGTSTAYEVKTEYDSARRLQTQTSDYLKAFERVFVVAHPASAANYAVIVPAEVGVLSLTRRGSLSIVKSAQSAASHLDSVTMFRCLRREEYLSALAPFHPGLAELPNGIVGQRAMEAFQQLRPSIAHKIFMDALRSRSTSGETPKFLESLPRSLRALGCGTPLSNPSRQVLISALASPIRYSLA